MENYNWLIHTLGVISIIWTVLGIVNIITLLDDPRVQYGLVSIKIYWHTWVVFILNIIYISWCFFG